jgi:dTDP-L-rhamnose 4-epimerase
MRILVTGGAGFIGSHVADLLTEAENEIVLLDGLDPQVHNTSSPGYRHPSAEFIIGDIRDRSVVTRALQGVDVVIHLAAAVGVGQSMYQMEHYCSVNVLGTAILLEEILNHRPQLQKLVVASSMSIYGEGQYGRRSSNETGLAPGLRSETQLSNHEWELLHEGEKLIPEPTKENKPLKPTSVYAVTKRDQEELVLTFGTAYGIPSVALRFFNVYGPRQSLSNPYTGVAAIFSSRLLNGKPPLIYEDGNQTRDFIHVRDIARAVVLAVSSEKAGGHAINIGTGRPISILEIAHTLAEGLGVDIEPEVVGQFRAGDVRHCYADTALAGEVLGFSPEIDFEQGIQDLLQWVSTNEAEDRLDAAHKELLKRKLAR